MLTVKGTLPVRSRRRMEKATRVSPRERERYSSRVVDSRTSGERRAMMTVGETMSGMASRTIQPEDTVRDKGQLLSPIQRDRGGG